MGIFRDFCCEAYRYKQIWDIQAIVLLKAGGGLHVQYLSLHLCHFTLCQLKGQRGEETVLQHHLERLDTWEWFC